MSDGVPGVYVFCDVEGGAIYIGYTAHLATRMKNHERWKAWWPEVASIEWRPMPTTADALVLEGRLIASLKPRHNGTKLIPQIEPEDSLTDAERDTLRSMVVFTPRWIDPQGHEDQRTALTAYVRSLMAAGRSDGAIAQAVGRATSWATGFRTRRRYEAA